MSLGHSTPRLRRNAVGDSRLAKPLSPKPLNQIFNGHAIFAGMPTQSPILNAWKKPNAHDSVCRQRELPRFVSTKFSMGIRVVLHGVAWRLEDLSFFEGHLLYSSVTFRLHHGNPPFPSILTPIPLLLRCYYAQTHHCCRTDQFQGFGCLIHGLPAF